METRSSIQPVLSRAVATLTIATVVAAIGSIACALYFWRTQPPAAVYNSDLLVLVDFFHDLANFPGAVSQFQLPRIPSLVPDIVLFSAVSTVVADYHLALVAYSVVQCFVFVVAAGYLISMCTNKPLGWCFSVLALTTAVTVVLNGTFGHDLHRVVHDGHAF
jgi:hypothetical protein